MSSAAVKKVLVYGGSGALGSALVGHFKQKQYVNPDNFFSFCCFTVD